MSTGCCLAAIALFPREARRSFQRADRRNAGNYPTSAEPWGRSSCVFRNESYTSFQLANVRILDVTVNLAVTSVTSLKTVRRPPPDSRWPDHCFGQRIHRAGSHDFLDAFPGPLERRVIVRQRFPKILDPIRLAREHDVLVDRANFWARVGVFDQS